jgi:Ca2+-binding EF-hand superfamily protein
VKWRVQALLICLCFSQALLAQSRERYFNAIDANSNGKISLEEFQEWMSYAFVRIDKNRDDVIDENEALVPKMRGVTRARHRANIAAQFHRQDANRNGNLSMSELTAPPR